MSEIRKLFRLISRYNRTNPSTPISQYHSTRLNLKPHYIYLMKWMPNNLATDNKILEVGCGTGLFGYWLNRHGYKDYVGVDICPELIDIAKQYASLDYRVMDGRNLDFEDKSFDFVGIINTFFNKRPKQSFDCEAFLDEAIRVSRRWIEFDTAYNRPEWEAPTFGQVREWLEQRGIEDNLIVEKRLTGNHRIWIVEL